MHLQPHIPYPGDDLFALAQLPGGDGEEVVGVRIASVIGAGDFEGVLAAQKGFVFLVAPQGNTHHHVGEAIPRHLDQPVGGAEGGQATVEGLHPIQAEGGFAADEDGQIHPALHLRPDKVVPPGDIFFLAGRLVFSGGKEETALAAQVAAVGDIVDRTADIQPGDTPVALVPGRIEEGTHRFHDSIRASSLSGTDAPAGSRLASFS